MPRPPDAPHPQQPPQQPSQARENLLIAAVEAVVRRQLARPLEAGLHLVATPIGQLSDITLRALAVLAQADVIYCEDTRVSRVLLAHYGIDRPLRTYHEHNAERERPAILAALADGRAVAVISDAGTPLISDPGYKLVGEAIAQGARIYAAPGPSAVLAALVSAGLPSDTFLFAGFLPTKSGARRSRIAELASIPATLVLYEAPVRLAETLDALAAGLGDRRAAIARELTKLHEELRRDTLTELATWARSGRIRGEVVIVVAPPAPALATAVGDDEIRTRLTEALEGQRLSEAARIVSDRLGVPRSRVYDIGIALRQAADGAADEPDEAE